MTKNESLQIGELIGEVKGINKRLDNFNGQIKDLAENIGDLPCQEHSVRIKLLEKGCSNSNTERRLNKSIHGNIRAQIYGGLIGAGVTALGAWLTHTWGLW